MKSAAIFASVLLVSCVTAQDVRDVSDSVARLEAVLNDETKTTVDVQAQLEATKKEVASVADRVEERTDGFIDSLTSADTGGVAGLMAAAAAIALNTYRNHTRRRVLASADSKQTES